MNFKVGVGKSDFAALRESGNYYVDKTELIYELVNDTDNEVTLISSVYAKIVRAYLKGLQ